MKSSTRTGRRACAVIAAVTGIFLASQAWADVAVCTGKLTTVANHVSGANGLYIKVGSSGLFKVCNFVSQQFTVYPDDCKHMASLAAMAFAMDSDVVVYIDNAPTTNCADVPNWHVSNTRYFNVSR